MSTRRQGGQGRGVRALPRHVSAFLRCRLCLHNAGMLFGMVLIFAQGQHDACHQCQIMYVCNMVCEAC